MIPFFGVASNFTKPEDVVLGMMDEVQSSTSR